MKHSSTNFSLPKTESPRLPLEQSMWARKGARTYRVVFSLALMASISACERHEPPSESISEKQIAIPATVDRDTYSQPSIQDEFEGLRAKLRLTYSSAKNEIIKSSIFNTANERIDHFFSSNGTYAKNWNGEIKTISTSHGGKDASLVVVGVDGTTYSMSDIDRNSELYREISLLQEGQRVIFSGSFQKSAGGKWERSFTERGSLEVPEYIFIFERIGNVYANAPRPSIEKLQIPTPRMVDASPQQLKEPSVDLGALPQEILDLDPVEVALRSPAGGRQSTGFRGTCNLLVGMLIFTVVERDHGIFLKKSQQNIARVLEGMEVPESDIEVWQSAAETIHVTQISGQQLQILNKKCERLPFE